MATATETGHVTGTKDKDYDLIWYVEACLDNALRLETCIQDAEGSNDAELAELFRKAQADSRKGAQMGKELLRSRLTTPQTDAAAEAAEAAIEALTIPNF